MTLEKMVRKVYRYFHFPYLVSLIISKNTTEDINDIFGEQYRLISVYKKLVEVEDDVYNKITESMRMIHPHIKDVFLQNIPKFIIETSDDKYRDNERKLNIYNFTGSLISNPDIKNINNLQLCVLRELYRTIREFTASMKCLKNKNDFGKDIRIY